MLVVFDVEGVLLDAEYLPVLAKFIGKEKEIMDITIQGLRGEIPWKEGLLKRVEALRGIDYDKALEIALNLPITKGAKEVCQKLKMSGWRLLAVSGGFGIITDRLKDELGIEHIFSNELIFKNGKLTGVDINVNSDKPSVINGIIRQWDEKKDDIVAVVDGANDLELFNIVGLRVAFNAQKIIKEKADVIIDEKDLTLLIDAIEKHYGTISAKSTNKSN